MRSFRASFSSCWPPRLKYAHAVPQFSQMKANDEIRWAVLNVVGLLRRHSAVHDKLAAAMARGASVGACIAIIEGELTSCGDI